MPSDLRQELKTFFNALQDRPLPPNDPYYVRYIENQVNDDPIEAITQKISWSDAATLELLSGQRGCGKSTQLLRLKAKLEDEGCTVFLCDMKNYLNLSMPVEIGDFLLSLMAGLSQAITEQTELGDPTRKSYWQRIKQFLNQEVKIEKFGAEAELEPFTMNFEASLKDDPDFKDRLQKALKGHTSALVRQAREFVEVDVVKKLRTQLNDPDHKVVLLVDSVEQLRGDDEVHKSVETLFSAQGENLRFPSLHMVYTVPPFLVPMAPGLGRNLGATLRTLPSVHVRKRSGEDDPAGLSTLKTMVGHRYSSWENIFTDDQMNDIARSTGGDLRDFFRLIREALVLAPKNWEQLPVAGQVLQSAKNIIQREMGLLALDDIEWLRKIAVSKNAELPSVLELPRLARFFDTHLVLNYRNGEDWYDVHPLLTEVLKPSPSATA